MSVPAVLSDLLHRAVAHSPHAQIVHVLADGSERVLLPGELLADAARIGAGLRAAGLTPGAPVLLVCGAGDAFVRAFWGATAAGVVPVPLALEEDKLRRVWTKLAGPALIVDEITAPLLAPLAATGMIRVLALSELLQAAALDAWYPAKPDDVAFLQFSSGSTGAPKGVVVRHRNLVHNIAQQNEAVRFAPDDVVVSWMPYFHDLGLIGMHLAPIAVGAKQVRIDPLHFVKRPVVWLEALDRHRGTVTGAASFALGLVCKRVTDEQIAAFDLSPIRLFGVGAEPISPRMCRLFADKLAPAGFDGEAIAALYGLAEATLAVACTPAGEPMRVLGLDRAALADGRAVDAPAGSDTVEMTELGLPVPDCRIRVVDDDDRELPDDRVGHIQVAGPHVTTGYHGDERASAALHCGAWLRTGDMGFMRAGRLTLTGRAKEVLIVNGRNFYASDLEAVALEVRGVRPGRIAVVGYRDTDGDVERVVAFIGRERAESVESVLPTVRAVRAALRRTLGHEHVDVLPIPKQAFPRTTSGKLQRVKLRKQVEAGEHRALADQVAAALAAEPAAPRAVPETSAAALAPALADVEAVVVGLWARVLERAPDGIERDTDFRELGGTSLRAMEVLAGLEDAYGRVFEPATVRDCATVRLLAARVHELLRGPAEVDAVARPATSTADGPPGVAMLSAACRFPGADSAEQFWQNLLDGVDSVGDVPPERWSADELEPGAPRWGAFLDHVDRFDGEHFGMGDDEAAFTDPHQRIMLEVAHEALERAGYAGERRVGKRVGMFVAVSESEYQRLLQPSLTRGATFPVSAIVGNLRNLIAARLSQCLDLTGPAIAIDTACSSALVALHLARASLLAGECDLAVVGAVSLNLTSTAHRMFARAEALSPTGRCRTFSAEADGFVPGEGAGAVVLARHADAARDRDQILALVRGSAINNDGRSMSAMAPNPVLQAQVIADAYRDTGIDPDSVAFIEAHGTGTAIGDPIEVRSLATTFRPPGDGSRRVVGSVKTNIGHLLNAAGMPGLIKAALSLYHRRLAPSLHYATASPRFDLAAAGFEVLTHARPWSRTDGPRRAAVNAFGFGGTNAHVVLEEAPEATEAPSAAGPALLTLSARTDGALRTASASLAAFARARQDVGEARLAACASVARDHRARRVAVVSDGDVAERLDEAAGRERFAVAGRPHIAFLFAGQGSQRPGQGGALYRRWPVFRAAVERLAQAAGPVAGRSLVDWLLDDGADAERLRATEVAQPVLVAFEIALAELWADWGIAPRAVVGHSVGELAAAAVAGALSAEDAVRIAVERGRLMGALQERGTMAAVFADADTVRAALGADAERASVAAINAPSQVAISGATDAVERILGRLERAGIAARALAVSHAFHSPLMDPVIAPLRAFVATLSPRAPRLPWLSTVTGELVAAAWDAPAYFADHVAQPVRFAAAVQRLGAEAADTFVELGPKRTLAPLVAGTLSAGGAVFASVDGVDDVRAMLTTAGALWERGAPLRRSAVDGVVLPWLTVPTYPFERRRHWAPSAPQAVGAPTHPPSAPAVRALPALGLLSRVDALHLDRADVSGELRGSDPVVADHEVCDFHIAPGAALWQLALEAADHVSAEPRRRLADVTLFAPLRVDRNERRPVAVGLRAGRDGYTFELRAGSGDGAALVATGRVERGGDAPPAAIDLAAVARRCARELPVATVYEQLAARGMVHGPFYQCLTSLRTGEREALGRLALSERAVARGGAFALHPALLDASMQVVAGLAFGAAGDGADADAGLYIPFSLASLELYEPIAGPCVSYVRAGEPGDGRALRCDVTVCGEDGRVLAALRGLELRRVTPGIMRELCAPARAEQLLHRVAWHPVEAPADGPPPAHVWILPDAGELHAVVAESLGRAGSRCVTLSADDAAARLHAGEPAPDAILCLSGLGLGAPRSRGGVERGVERALLGLARLARAIDAREPGRRPGRLIAVTSDACGIAGARPVRSPLAAALATYAACLADELPGLAARAADVSSSATASEVAAIARRELADLGGPRRVAWVGEQRHTMSVEAGAPATDAGRRPRLRDDSVLLITGGATGVGAALARSLAAPGRRAVLVGRTPLAQDAARAAVVDELARDYASARYVCADITDPAAVAALVADVVAVEGRLSGVVHAAGVADPDRLGARDDARVRAVLAPKVVGGWLLAQAVADADCALDFFALCSSVSAVLPGLGGAMADYAAANAFLDGLAGAERADGQPFVSINWSIWGETGMGAHPATRELVRRNGLEPLATRDAVAAFRAALATGAVQVVVADRVERAPSEPRAGAPSSAVARKAPLDLAGLSLERALQTLVGAALAVHPDRVPTDQSFLALGLDSLAAVDLVKKLERHVGRTLSTTLFFEYDTIDRLTAYLGEGAAKATPARATAVAARGAGDDEPFALTPVQRAFYANHYLYPEVTAYAYLRLNLGGALDEAALGRALALLEARHPMLRARFSPVAERPPRQWTMAPAAPAPPAPAWFRVVESAPDPESFDHRIFNARFDLAAGEAPLRAELWRRTPEVAYLGLCLHHIAGDAWSLNILADELWRAYTALVAGEAPALPPLEVRFSDCATWRAADTDARRERDVAYWRDVLQRNRAARAAVLPCDGDPDGERSGPFGALRARADGGLVAALRARAAGADVSLVHLLMAAYGRCLARWTGQRAVGINVARAGREARVAGIERVVGSFADTLPLYADCGAGSATDLARRLREVWLDSERHGSVTTVDLAGLLSADGVGPRVAAPASFSFARFPVELAADCPVRIEASAGGTASAATRLGLAGWEQGDALLFSWSYPARLFARATVERFAGDYLDELAALAEQRDAPVAVRSASAARSVVDEIVERCRRHPDRVAVEAGDRSLCYGELDDRSGRIAAALRARGARAGRPIGLLVRAGVDAFAAIVGILRAGAAWVPLDPEHPPRRLVGQLVRAGVELVVCHEATREVAAQLGHAIDLVDASALAPVATPLEPAPFDPDDTAYVIHTSGSTGQPKAVPIRHASLAAYLRWAIDTFGYTETDRLAQTASLCFDASVRQILAPLMVGATAVVVDKELTRDPERLLDTMVQARLTVWSSVPSLWGRLLACIEERTARGQRPPPFAELRWLHVGGEALSAASVRRWMDIYGERHRISNLYGPTETTINATCYVVRQRPGEAEPRVPIGTPIAGARVKVVADGGGACAVGEPGELWIGGAGLSCGYLGDPELTARVFVVDEEGARWYRSGDRVMLRADGQLEFVGRIDDQLKLRGYRVEPGEIEAVLEQHDAVHRAAVVVDGDRLGAVVEARGELDAAALRRFAAEWLPDYMVPGGVEVVAQLPRTSTGKVDRAALRSRTSETAATVVCAPPAESREATPMERVVAEVWAEVLGVSSVGLHDDFFHLGGDSLLILEVFARLQGRVPRLPRPTALYRHRTVASLAAAIDGCGAPELEAGGAGAAASADAGRDFGLAPAQIGFLIAEAMQPGAGTTWSTRCRIDGPLDPVLFQRALDYLVERHAMLRTVFPPRVGLGAPQRQRELPTGRLRVAYEDLRDAGDAAVEARWRAHLAEPLAPDRWPLIRTALLRTAREQHLWLITAHHLIGDGFSAALLGRELVQVYDQLAAGAEPALPPLRTTFRDYVEHMARAARHDRAADEAYWREQLGAPYTPPVLRTLADTEVGAAEIGLEEPALERLRGIASEADTTLYAVLLAAFARAASAVTARDELILGTAVSGREVPLADVTRVFGCFATTLPVRVRSSRGALADDVARVHRVFAEARERALPPDRIARLLPGRSPAQTLGAQLFFTYLDFEAAGAAHSELLALHWDDGGVGMDPPPQTDVLVAARRSADGLRITIKGRGVPAAVLERFVDQLRADLAPGARRRGATAVDAALIGYLPALRDIAALLGDSTLSDALPAQDDVISLLGGAEQGEWVREQTRALLGLGAAPRALEVVETPLGRSAFVCLPRFADQLASAAPDELAAEVERGIDEAARLGARCVSLAGMLPALTRYGYAIESRHGNAVRVTTGHAATAVSVVKTVLGATRAIGADLASMTVAFVGLGSIGRASLQLLLSRVHPGRLVLCEAVGRGDAISELIAAVRGSGYGGDIELVESSQRLPRRVYEAELIVGAASSPALLDLDALRPGMIVVDDSFPHIFEPARAIERMRTRSDVLVVGGGLLDCRATERSPVVSLDLPAPIARTLSGVRPPGVVASCQLESLLCAAHPELPTVRGLVEPDLAREYWHAVERSGIDAAALHLQHYFPGEDVIAAVRAARARGQSGA